MRRIAAGLFSTVALVLLVAPGVSHAAVVRAEITWNQANDIDLYALDGAGHEAYFADTDAIPEALLSSDVTDSGGPETFTDQQEPSTRPFAYRVCYFVNDDSDLGPTDVIMTIVDSDGARREETFTLAAPGDCRDVGDLTLLVDGDADLVADANDNCATAANTDQADADADGAGDACDATPTGDPPAPPPPPPPPPPTPEPELGKSVVAGKVSGTIRVKSKNGKFRTLGANEEIPVGSTVDATNGKVRLTSAANAAGARQSALFFQGAFVITQTRGSKPVTQLALSGTLSCPKNKKASTSQKKKKVRRLWGDGKGRFRTKGKHGAATVRGTRWLTEDRCGNTLVRVRRGSVAVRDFAKKKTVLVKKGKSYVARAKKK